MKSLNERTPDSALAGTIRFIVWRISLVTVSNVKRWKGFVAKRSRLIGKLEGMASCREPVSVGVLVGERQKEDAARVPPITATIYAEEQSIRVPLLPAVFMTR